MNNITITIKGQFVEKSSKNAGSMGSSSTRAEFIFDDSWSGFSKRVIWHNSKGENQKKLILSTQLTGEKNRYISYIPP